MKNKLKKIALIGLGTSQIGFLNRMIKNGMYQKYEIHCYENGKDLDERISDNDVLTGFGGSGTFSDGKLSISPEIGGEITDLIGEQRYQNYLNEVIDLWTRDKNIEQSTPTNNENKELVDMYELNFRQNNLKLKLSNFYHIGTDILQEVLREIREEFRQYDNIKMFFNKNISIKNIEKDYEYVIISTGRYNNNSSNDVQEIFKSLDLEYSENKIDIGVRYEVPHEITKWLTDLLYEFKVCGYSDTNEMVRTFCVNPQGYVVNENGKDFQLVNGHSFKNKKSDNTNFQILVTQKMTEPFKDQYLYGSSLVTLSNKLQGERNKILIQRYGDFNEGRRTTDNRLRKGFVHPTLEQYSPGDLNLVFPRRIQNSLSYFIESMSTVIKGMNNPDNLMYGIEQKFYSTKPYFNNEPFRLRNSKYFIIGDASGYTRGIVQQTMTGMYLADRFMKI